MRIICLDIGGTSIKSGIWNGKELLQLKEWDTEADQGGSNVMERAKNIISDYLPCDAIGISTAGQVDSQKGRILYANENIPNYTGICVKEMMEEAFSVPVAVDNDVNCAALGEAIFGAGKEYHDFLCLTYGTGVGGAVVMERKIYTGASWSAGEFGGIITHPEDVEPGVPFSGCYEKYASVTALVKRAMAYDPNLSSGIKIFECGQEPAVLEIIDQWIEEITYGLATLVHIFNPACIVLGGGIMAQNYVVKQTQDRLRLLVMKSFRQVDIRPALLGNKAGMAGAACQAEQLMKKRGN